MINYKIYIQIIQMKVDHQKSIIIIIHYLTYL